MGTINNGEDSEVVDALSAKVTIDFMDTSGSSEGFDTVKVTILNTTPDLPPGDTDLSSLISAFYLRKPTAPTDAAFLVTSDPINWILDTDGSNEFNNFMGSWDMDNYFGAHANGVARLAEAPPAPAGVFYFAFADFTPSSPYEDDQAPMVFIRWQSINNVPGETDEGSGMGAGGTPGWERSVVPEPSEVALMAMLGLGGLLWTRRRFVKK